MLLGQAEKDSYVLCNMPYKDLPNQHNSNIIYIGSCRTGKKQSSRRLQRRVGVILVERIQRVNLRRQQGCQRVAVHIASVGPSVPSDPTLKTAAL